MDFIPNTETDLQAMLADVGIRNYEELLAGIPSQLRQFDLNLPPALSEPELQREMIALAAKNISLDQCLSFLGAGAYEHFIPAAIDVLVNRGEFATAYTPYQAEASQGTLQAIYEYQSLICRLTGMDVSNASLYDGGSAIGEAAHLSLGVQPKRKKILVSQTVHPEYRQILHTYMRGIGTEIVEIPYHNGMTHIESLCSSLDENTACVIVQSPNFFGSIEPMRRIAELAHAQGVLFVASVNPISLGLLSSPGEYGADFVVGEGQPLGIPLSFGGPWLGFLACPKKLVHKISGRLVGRTVDREGRPAFCLTLQAREQHIRREKATSNICTNQSLMALRATIFLSLLGKQGMRELAELNVRRSHQAAAVLGEIPGFSQKFHAPFFNEFVLTCPIAAEEICLRLEKVGILAGLPVGRFYPGMEKELLVCVTDVKQPRDLDRFVAALHEATANLELPLKEPLPK